MAKGIVKRNRNSFNYGGLAVFAGDVVELEIEGLKKFVEVLAIFEGKDLYMISTKDGHKNRYIKEIRK